MRYFLPVFILIVFVVYGASVRGISRKCIDIYVDGIVVSKCAENIIVTDTALYFQENMRTDTLLLNTNVKYKYE